LLLSIEKSPNSPLALAINSQSAQVLVPPTDFSASIVVGTKEKAIEGYNQYVKRTFVIPSFNGTTSDVSVVRLDTESSELNYVPTAIQNSGGKATVDFYRRGNSAYAVIRRTKSFTDMSKHWANSDVTALASRFIVDGITATGFGPGKNITRVDFAEYIARGLGLTGSMTNAAKYSDVGLNNVAAPYIGAVSKAGIVEGGADGKFRPNASITREEMATMLVRAMNYAGVQTTASSSVLDGFKDKKKISGWASNNLAISVQAGFIKGSTTNTVNPQSYATRAEAAVMIKRFLEYVEFL
jgi:hypothetical protein